MTIFSPPSFMAAKSVSVSLPGFTSVLLWCWPKPGRSLGRDFQNDVVDQPGRADASCRGEHGRAVEVDELDVVGLQTVERRLCGGDGIVPVGISAEAGVERSGEG